MSTDIFNAFLGAIAALILESLIVWSSYRQYQKDKRIKYTATERGLWRDRLYEVIKDGPESLNLYKISSLINPYQYAEDFLTNEKNEINIMHDEHIWIAIHENNKELVYQYILLLLKFERERAKYELMSKKPEEEYDEKKNEYIRQVENVNVNFRLNTTK